MAIDQRSKTASFSIAEGDAIDADTRGTMRNRGNAECPFCRQITSNDDLAAAGRAGLLGQKLVAVIEDGDHGKAYRIPETADLEAVDAATEFNVEPLSERILPEITTAKLGEEPSNSSGIRVHRYGMTTWGSLFSHRQLVALQTFCGCLEDAWRAMEKEDLDLDYRRAVRTYLALWISRSAMRMTKVGRWNVGGEKFESPFDGARLPMKWDYPEVNPLNNRTGGFGGQLDWILRFLRRESFVASPSRILYGDGAALALDDRSVAAVVTDPPYFDEAAYADLSDFFYVWLKRMLADDGDGVLATPQTPKTEEATALKHRHEGSARDADLHFRRKLTSVFSEARRICCDDGVVSVIFAHQSTEAWSALVSSLFESGLTIVATWPIEMEMKNRVRGIDAAALETSIVVVCRTRIPVTAVLLREIQGEIRAVVAASVERFWSYGFRGADLVVSCYGPAVGVFGGYERVERGDGSLVGIEELLELARDAARDAIAGEFEGDSLSLMYYVWANLYGVGEQAWDDARLLVQIGSDDEDAMDVATRRGVFVVAGSRCRLALLSDRTDRQGLGVGPDSPLIDVLHRAMLFWQQEDRSGLVTYLVERDVMVDDGFWKLAQSLFEIFPRDTDDWRILRALLSQRDTLRREARTEGDDAAQRRLF